MTTYSTDEAQDAIAGLVGAGQAAIPGPILLAEALDGARQAYAQVCAERDRAHRELAEAQILADDLRTRLSDARQRITDARRIVFPLMRDREMLGELAKSVDNALDPRPEPAA